jgi:hypothetical protein
MYNNFAELYFGRFLFANSSGHTDLDGGCDYAESAAPEKRLRERKKDKEREKERER